MNTTSRSWARRLLPLWLAIIAITVIVVLAKTGDKPTEATETQADPSQNAYVATSIIQAGSYAPQLTLYGTLNAQDQVHIISQSSGKISKVNVTNGQSVKKGDVLIVIDHPDLQFQLTSAKANLDDIKAKINSQNIQYNSDVEALNIEQSLLSINEAALKRQSTLVKDALASQSDLESTQRALQSQKLMVNSRKLSVEKYQSNLQQLKATQTQLQSNLEQLQTTIDDLIVTAQFDGVVNQLNIKKFEDISANTHLLTLVNQSELEVQAYAAINNLQFDELNIGAKAIGYIDDKKINVTLTSYDQVANNGSVKLTFSANYPSQLAVNRYIRIQLPLKSINNIYSVPVQSVYSNNRIYQVIDSQLKRIDVQVVGKSNNQLLIKLLNNDEVTKPIHLLTTRLNDAINGLKVNEIVDSQTQQSVSTNAIKTFTHTQF